MTQIRGRICHTGDSYDQICHMCREFFIRETNTFQFFTRQMTNPNVLTNVSSRVRIGQKCTDFFV